MRRLNGVDALMLYLDGGSAYNHTLKISVLDPSTDPDGWSWPKARQMFEERAHLLPVFRLRYLPTPLGLHHPIWVEDPEFDLDAHVRRVVCPAPGGMAEFCALVEQIYAHPLDRDRPLWQTWVVEGLDGGRVALVTLLHHAYSDGVGVLDMLAAFYNDTPDEAPVVAPPWEPPPLPSTRQRLGWALRDLPSRLGKIAPTVRAVRDRVRIEREFAKDGDRRVPPTFDRSAPQLVPMGAPKASPVERLKEINAATTRAKDKGRGMQTTSRQAYALLLLGSLTVADALPLLGKLPSANVVISNMKGPTEQLYLAGAPLVAFSGLPIVPPGAGLNVTFASINTALCIAIGAAPEAVHEPSRLAELMQRAFTELQTEAGTTSPTTSKSRTP